MIKDVIIAIPVYQPELIEQEKRNLENNIAKLSDYDICFVCPSALDMTYYQSAYPEAQIQRFENFFFEGLQGYNKLMLSPEFYSAFVEYRYVCICQTDVWILRDGDCLNTFLEQGYDYYGAPWFPPHRIYPFSDKLTWRARWNLFWVRKKVHVGNGGLSLRKVQSILAALEKNAKLLQRWKIYEDYFYAYIGEYVDSSFHVAPVDVAKKFALETDSRRLVMDEKIIPVGLHAPHKWFAEVYTLDMSRLTEDGKCEN